MGTCTSSAFYSALEKSALDYALTAASQRNAINDMPFAEVKRHYCCNTAAKRWETVLEAVVKAGFLHSG